MDCKKRSRIGEAQSVFKHRSEKNFQVLLECNYKFQKAKIYDAYLCLSVAFVTYNLFSVLQINSFWINNSLKFVKLRKKVVVD